MTSEERMDEWLTAEEIGALLKVEPGAIRGWLREGKLRGINFSGKMGWRVRRRDLEAYLEARLDAQAQQAKVAA
jgi:excisionase family DNA binding protein